MSDERAIVDREHDLLVIGSGPGGEGAAMLAAKRGASVVIVERQKEVGGGCTHWATIPSKALRHQVQTVLDFRKSPLFGAVAGKVELSFPQLLAAGGGVIQKQVAMRREHYRRNHVQVVHGHAHFVDAQTVEVAASSGPLRIRARRILVAVGSRPYRPADVDFTHPRVLDSDTVLSLEHTPDSITIYGAGVVGCEYASIFRNLGVKVNLVNGREKLLSFLDDEIIDALSYHLREQGVVIRHNEQHQRVEANDDGVVLHLESGKKLKSDLLLWAQGRAGNTHDLGLSAIGVSADSRGNLRVDASHRVVARPASVAPPALEPSTHSSPTVPPASATRAPIVVQAGGEPAVLPSVYAVGDVVGYPSLASASYDQGRFAAMHALDGESDFALVQQTPTGIYTSPEISSLGKTERELTAAKVPYEVGHAQFRSLARAQITGNVVGMLKILFHRETLEILGIHCFGDQAAEIVHIGQAIMSQKGPANTVRYFVNTTFNYPTMAEAYRVAALNGLNRL